MKLHLHGDIAFRRYDTQWNRRQVLEAWKNDTRCNRSKLMIIDTFCKNAYDMTNVREAIPFAAEDGDMLGSSLQTEVQVSMAYTAAHAMHAGAPLSAPLPDSSVRPSIRALCIGINAYNAPVPALTNAVADATAVHAALRALPSATSRLLTDCTYAEFEAALVEFRGMCGSRGMCVNALPIAANDAAQECTLGIVFFAGHGLQVNGHNFLVPSDFRVPARNDKLEVMLKDTARACISLDAVEETLEDAGVFAGSVLLDCCRNVPDFLAELGAKRSVGGGTRALPAGMGDAKPSLADLMVTFATAPGTEARDRSSHTPAHSPFTAALLKALQKPRRLLELNPYLTDEVAADSGGQQRPHVGGSYGTAAGNLLLG